MKKLLLAGFLFVGTFAFGQILTEDFESATSPALPAGWTTTTTGTSGFTTGNDADANAGGYWPVPAHTQFAQANDDVCNCDMSAVYLTSPAMNFTGKSGVAISYDCVDDGSYGGNPHSVEVSINGGSSWTSIYTHTFDPAVEWESVVANLGASTDGQADVRVRFKYDDGGTWATGLAIDNVVVYELPAYDVELTSLNIAPYVAAGNLTISGVVTNKGANTITSLDIAWNDGGAPNNQTFPVNITPGGTYNFNHGTQLNVVAGTSYTINVDVTLASDANTADNSLSAPCAGLTLIPAKTVVGEEKTGTWCGWCPRGAVGLSSMASTSNFIGIAVHNSDPMAVTAYDNGTDAIPGFTGYPYGGVDRVIGGDPSTFNSMHATRETEIVPCDVKNIVGIYNQATSQITVSADAEFYGNISGNYRMSCVLVEDDVTGTGSSWDQTNYYSYQSQNLALTDPVTGFDWQAATNPASPAAFGYYDHVGRYLSSNTILGTPLSLPTSNVPIGVYSYTFPTIAGSTINDPNKTEAVVMVVNASTGEILNAGSSPLQIVTSVDDLQNVNYQFRVYPNPTTDVAEISFSLNAENSVKLEVYNALGSLVYVENEGVMNNGNHNISFDGSELTNGIYFVNLTIGDNIITKKLSISK